jgi:hypothetical protein
MRYVVLGNQGHVAEQGIWYQATRCFTEKKRRQDIEPDLYDREVRA